MRGKFELKEDDEVKTKETLELAGDNMTQILKHDKEFVIIYMDLLERCLLLGYDDKMKENVEKAMQLLHKFPEPLQYETKANYFRFVEKNPEKTIKLYSKKIVKFLLLQNVKLIIIACNTASSLASIYLKDLVPI